MRQRDQLAETQSQCRRPRRLCDSPTRSLPDPKFRHPGYDELRAVVRALICDAGLLAEDDALALVAHGLREVALRMAVSERTIRRRFDAAGKPVHTVVHRVRIEATRCTLAASVPTTVIARWLGFTNPEAYRRFVRREMGTSIREIRVHVRQSAAFHAARACIGLCVIRHSGTVETNLPALATVIGRRDKGEYAGRTGGKCAQERSDDSAT